MVLGFTFNLTDVGLVVTLVIFLLILLAVTICLFSGLMMLHLDMTDWLARYFVYSVAVTSLLMVWQLGTTFNFRFSRTKDVGISVYLCIVVAFFYTSTPLGSGLICLTESK